MILRVEHSSLKKDPCADCACQRQPRRNQYDDAVAEDECLPDSQGDTRVRADGGPEQGALLIRLMLQGRGEAELREMRIERQVEYLRQDQTEDRYGNKPRNP